MQQNYEEAESLISVINAINSTMDPQQMFELVIKKAVELIPDVDGAAIVTFDAAGKSITLRAGYGYYKKLIEEQTKDFDISERVIECGSPFLISPSVEETESGTTEKLGPYFWKATRRRILSARITCHYSGPSLTE